MQKLGDLMKAYKPQPIKQISRGQWLSMFFHRLEKDWLGRDQLTRMRVGVAMKKFPDWELPVIWKLCETSKNFSACFWGTAKKRPAIKKEKKPKNLTLKM